MSESGHIRRLARAWILVSAADEQRTAKEIYALNDTLAWPHSQVVRADVVDAIDGADGVNIVVPVWAPDIDGVRKVLELIEGLPNVKATQFVTVRLGQDRPLHHPFPPQTARGYVTTEEENSPVGPMGVNAWG